MRKLILFSALALVAMACNPLKVALNKTDSEGVRTIVTSAQHFFNDYDVALGVRVSNADTIMGIVVSTSSNKLEGIFDQDDHLYFTLNDGSKVTLRNILDRDAIEVRKETKTDYNYANPGFSYAYGPWGRRYFISPYAASSYFSQTYETTVVDSYALYLITYEEMARIINIGVKTLSIEADNNTEEMMSTSGLQTLFRDMLQCLASGVRNPNEY